MPRVEQFDLAFPRPRDDHILSLVLQPLMAIGDASPSEVRTDLVQLEREYGHLTSDETVDEAIIANAYTFTAAGRRFG